MKNLSKALTITATIDKGIWGSVNRLIGIALLLACGTVGAQTVNISSCTVQPSVDCVTGIDGLDVLGVSYNMTVLNGTFTDLFSDPASQLTSWGDLEWGQSVRQAIVNALNGLDPIPTRPTTKFVEDGLDDRHDSILHLPEEYQEFNSDPMGAFNGPCVVIQTDAPVDYSSCGTWLSHHRLAFATFTPAVETPETLLEQLDTAVTEVGPGTSFADKIVLAQTYLAVPDVQSTCAVMTDFLNQVRAQRGKKLTLETADQLTADAQAIMDAVGCN